MIDKDGPELRQIRAWTSDLGKHLLRRVLLA
jgi:hypothetical protein